MTPEENALLTQTGPGTPAGMLLRSYWQPVALADELPEGGAPLPVRIMSEDLVLFRDESGQPGLLGIHCAHRGADLSYGRLEDGGLRCIYHGWLYDRTGRCLEQPGEPAGSTFHERIRQTAYPCVELGGVILTYMGPGEPPELPNYEFLHAPPERRFASKSVRECNYAQGNEGNIDPEHLGLLHWSTLMHETSSAVYHRKGPRCTIEVEDTDFGVRLYTKVPFAPDRNYVKITNFIMPDLSAFEGSSIDGLDGYGVNWHVPIDDESHWVYTLHFDRRSSLVEQAARRLAGSGRQRTKANRYLQNREEMRSINYAGLGMAFGEQDACVIEGAGAIQDRTKEHLATTDRAIVAARRMLLQAIRDVQAGRPAPRVAHDPTSSRGNIVVMREEIPATVDWRAYLRSKTEPTRVGAPA